LAFDEKKSGNPSASSRELFLRAIRRVDWKRQLCMLAGVLLFAAAYLCPSLPDAVDPLGNHFPLTHEGKAALGLFLLAVTWWVFDVVPIGVTSITIGVIQALFLIRDPRVAFSDFMSPPVWFIFGSIIIGMAFTRTGLARRMAYRMLVLSGERTSMIYLGSFLMTGVLTMMMAHTAVAAVVYPLLMAVYTLYQEDDKPTRFGKGLFMGMAFTAAAGSVITLLGAARGVVAIGFFREMVGRDISFFQVSYYMFPLGWSMIFLLWGFFMIFFRPETKTIPGLRERAKALSDRLGPITQTEWLTMVIAFSAIALLILKPFIPVLEPLDMSVIILLATVLLFLFRVLTITDLEEVPWNIVLLFGGAMSIGFCLWQTGASRWIAVHGLAMFQETPGFVFIMVISLLSLIITNFIMNVSVIAIALPVALVIAGYLGISPELVMFVILATVGMPMLLLVGAAPNAIAFESRQFTHREFFMYGSLASALLMALLGLFIWIIWPLMGMPVLAP
jgi:sodium-dependent dicarboxylate transporter 2/3/5